MKVIREVERKYKSTLDRNRSLTEIIYEQDEEERIQSITKNKRVRQRKPKKFVKCQDCKNWAMNEISKTIGKCLVGLSKCPHMEAYE